MSEIKLVLESTVKEIELCDSNGEHIHTLRVDVSDSNTIQRYSELIKNLEHSSNAFEKEAADVAAEYEGKGGMDETVAYSRVHVAFLERCIAEIDRVFGEGTIKAVFKAGYEINEHYVPDEAAILEFVEKTLPVMGELFKTRFEMNRKRYNVNRKGGRK